MNYVLTKIGKLLTLSGAVKKRGKNLESSDLGEIQDGAIVIGRGKILWSGLRSELPSKFAKWKKVSAGGGLVMPGLIDSHTHLVFAGDRSREFEMRLGGKTYQEIANLGGGILFTVNQTRMASKKDLLRESLKRLDVYKKQGVTTVEIKTGYALDFESEKKTLEVISELKKKSGMTILSTFMAAHAVPPEFKGRKTEYVKVLTFDWLPKLMKHIDFVDMFIDDGYFDLQDAEILLNEAVKRKIKIKLHADEMKLTGGSETAVKFNALSADHLLKITEPEIQLLAKSEVTATLLPTTALFLKTDYAPARRLLDSGARVALATDYNPGTSPTQDLSLVGILSALQMNMKSHEIVAGLTVNAAFALGLESKKGALLPGYDADFLIADADSPAFLFYNFGKPGPTVKTFSLGKKI